MARTTSSQTIAKIAAKIAAKKAASRQAPVKKAPAKKAAAKKAPAKKATPRPAASAPLLAHRLDDALHQLRTSSSQAYRDGLARYAIPTDRAFGVPMGSIQAIAKRLGRDHELAAALWKSGWYEARLLASYLDDPAQVTAAQMDAWSRDFDNWAVCDTICFALFDRSPLAWRKIEQWAPRRDEYVRRAAFAMLASKTVHDKAAEDALFLRGLELIEAHAGDERNFVKKAINWALRSIGKRNLALHGAAVAVATRLADSKDAAPRWVGKDALRELRSAAVLARLAKKSRAVKRS
ncbi:MULTISPECIES: DNA alkylation repair protein [Lysobacter]|uniref:DNA alkylation repair protein n=1 Tax=Lysobacter TaxID=68 RepID=UPI001F32644F|nr:MULTISPECIES: DNA alkylation repair protein [Lysobacter]UJB18817.1 DNA alkylation repair protein [Lysobacter capsici]UJQ27458.1 DNA alkylation repair protein [Lysobacter gummosus]